MNASVEKYNWRYCQLGGMTRVDIMSGEDIAHLDELDQKKWTVLSCPVKGLNFDPETLQILDSDHDGRIQVREVIEKAKWLTSILSQPDLLFYGKSSVPMEDINPETTAGARIIAAANTVFELIKKEVRTEISSDDVASALSILQKKTHKQLPYGDASDDAVTVVEKLAPKISDYFVRCSLAAYHTDSTSQLDVNPARIAAISDLNLADCIGEIATYPLSHISPEGKLQLNAQINPAWQADFAKLKEIVLDKDFPGAASIDEAQWKEVLAKISAYKEGKESIKKKDADSIVELSEFLKLTANFNHFLRNYVTFSDFYSRNETTPAVFQAGKLYIDQRCCELCIEVTDMAAHNESAGLSGMYLLYCDCKSTKLGQSKTIVAAVTRGDVNYLRKGKNAIFYDREGNIWDATVVKIIDNPISIKQAFLSPYRKIGNWITEKINKAATDKETSTIAQLKTGAEEKIANASSAASTKLKQEKSTFDIAKFAGIFAAIGMAIGYISAAFSTIADKAMSIWYYLPTLIILIILVISGPSMFLAWCKLRKRNLAPLLNANGWTVNAASIINVAFGATLTSEAKYPSLELVDPIAAKQFKADKKKRTISMVIIAIIVIFSILYFTNTLAPLGLPW